MNFTKFIKMALNMTLKYYNSINTNIIKEEDIYIENTCELSHGYRICTHIRNNKNEKYIVEYDKHTKKVLSYIK